MSSINIAMACKQFSPGLNKYLIWIKMVHFLVTNGQVMQDIFHHTCGGSAGIGLDGMADLLVG